MMSVHCASNQCSPQLRRSKHSADIYLKILDEGQEDDIRYMVAFFEVVGEPASLLGALRRIFLSSHHHALISIQNGAMHCHGGSVGTWAKC